MVFEKMFEKGTIGKMTLRNRIVLPPMIRNFATKEGEVTERYIAHCANIAKGGVGMMIIEGSMIHPNGRGFSNAIGVFDDRFIPGLRKMARAIQDHGAKAGLQIMHNGRQTRSAVSGLPVIAPSPIPDPVMQFLSPGEVPRQMTLADITEIENSFAEAARRNKEAGFDFVEIHGAHGYIINQFLSPLTNQRKDPYGGSFENRLRFLLEIVERVRDQVGPDYPLVLRINGSDFIEGGMDLSYTQKIVQVLDQVGGIDAYHVSGVIYASYVKGYMIPPMALAPGCMVDLAAGIKKITSKPVITVGKIYRPEMVEDILKQNKADFVATGRWLLSDPEWPKKVREGQLEDINYCITCNQGCIDRVFVDIDVQCTVNPWCGRETDKGLLKKPALKVKKVMVVGGGPAGLEAAWVAAERGHKVTLYEKAKELGGQFLLAKIPPTREDIGIFTKYQIHQIEKMGVKVVTGKEVTPELVKNEKPDVVILAAGSINMKPDIPGITGPNVVDGRNVLAGKAATQEKVIVAGGGLVGCEIAEFLAEKNKKVKVVEMLPQVAYDFGFSDQALLLERLTQRGVEIFVNKKILNISEKGVTVESEGRQEMISGETIVLALGSKPDQALVQSLQGLTPELYVVGDCKEPRKGLEAVYEGAQIACQI